MKKKNSTLYKPIRKIDHLTKDRPSHEKMAIMKDVCPRNLLRHPLLIGYCDDGFYWYTMYIKKKGL